MTSNSIFAEGRFSITAAILTVMGLAAFGILAVVAALPEIVSDLGSVTLLSWVITVFLLTSTIATVAAGPVIDSLGVRTTFRLAIVVFVAASAACAVAPTMVGLIAFRAIQGVGGGLLIAVALATIGLSYPKRLRPRVLAANSATWGVMALGGPAIAALFVSTTGWRGIFLVNLPLGMVAALMAWSRLPDRRESAPQKIDFDTRGMVLLSGFTVLLLVGVSGLTWGSLAAAIGAIVLGLAYWLHSGRVSRPVMARRHFAFQPLGVINLAFGLGFGGALGVDAFLPVFVRGGLGLSPAVAAFSVAFLTVGWSAASFAASRILDRVSETVVALASYGLLIPATIAGLAIYSSSTPVWLVFSIATALGAGVGAMATSLLSLVQAESPMDEMGRATAAGQFARGVGQTFGTALIGTILFAVVRMRIGAVEPVRRLLSSDEVAADTATRDAIAAGFRLSHVVALTMLAASLALAVSLQRHLKQPWRREEHIAA